MKKLSLIVLLNLIISSCSSDDKSLDTTQSFKYIKTEFYENGIPRSYSIQNFENNKLVNIQYSEGQYTDFEYRSDFVSKISEYDVNASLTSATSYEYDNLGRIKQKNRIPSPGFSDLSYMHEILYNDNENTIQFRISWSDGAENNRTLSLDNSNRIERDIRNNLNDIVYTYSNNNLIQITQNIDNYISSELEFNYLNKEKSNLYTYEKYFFGSEWKNNLILDTKLGLVLDPNTHRLSNNYVSDYKLTIYQASEELITIGRFEYEFDSNDAIIKQIESINYNNGTTCKYVTTFIYN